jgi:ureidoglycolate lyase
MILSVLELSAKAFAPYGQVLKPRSSDTPEISEVNLFDFYVLLKETSKGWQIGYLNVEGSAIRSLERHPNTSEAFVPLRGSAALIVSSDPTDPDALRAFALDRPVVLNCGTWHNVICLGNKGEILIAESSDVVDEVYPLPEAVVTRLRQAP